MTAQNIRCTAALLLLAATAVSAAAPASALSGTWQVERMAAAEPPVPLVFEMDGAGAFHSKGGCNVINTRYTQRGGSLKFRPAASTRMMCAEDQMKADQMLEDALQKTRRYRIRSSHLEWLDAKGRVLLRAIPG